MVFIRLNICFSENHGRNTNLFVLSIPISISFLDLETFPSQASIPIPKSPLLGTLTFEKVLLIMKLVPYYPSF